MRTWCTEFNRSFGQDASAAADAATGVVGVGSILRAGSFSRTSSRSNRSFRSSRGGHSTRSARGSSADGETPSILGPEGPGSVSPHAPTSVTGTRPRPVSAPFQPDSSQPTLADKGFDLFHRATDTSVGLALSRPHFRQEDHQLPGQHQASVGARLSLDQRPSLARADNRVESLSLSDLAVGDRVECRYVLRELLFPTNICTGQLHIT